MLALNCAHCGRKSWYQDMDSTLKNAHFRVSYYSDELGLGPEKGVTRTYYSDEKGQRHIENCPGCGVSLDLREWEDHPNNDSAYGIVKLILLWVLRWGVIIDGQIVRSAPGMPLARWNPERECWRVMAEASDLELPDDFAPTQDFGDAWLIIEVLQDQAAKDEECARRYQRFLDIINTVWGTALLARNLAEGFKPWNICFAVLDAFDL